VSVIFLVSVVDDMVRYRRSISAQSLFFLNVLCSRTNSFFVFFFQFSLFARHLHLPLGWETELRTTYMDILSLIQFIVITRF
jgi:hypothetical protein